MKICVFCGSSSGVKGSYRDAAVQFGTLLAREGIGLVYGGASIGLMGAIADAVLAHDGDVTGIIPQTIADHELAHRRLTALHIVGSMHERKAMMAELSDAFVALPGGIGTLEELFEAWTWAQLGLHAKPCGLLNVAGFFDGLSRFLEHVRAEGFLRAQDRNLLLIEESATRLLSAIRNYVAPATTKLIDAKSS